MSKNSSNKVEVFERINKLKLKAGIPLDEDEVGYIDPKDVKEAQDIIDEREKHYTEEIQEILTKLQSTWDDLKTVDEKRQKQYLDRLQNYANNVKDLARTYNYQLMDHFGKSLRDFCDDIDVNRPEHEIIVKAHMDVMWVTFEEDIRDDGGEKARQLKAMVSQAISKYS